jgi:hypothetical protein
VGFFCLSSRLLDVTVNRPRLLLFWWNYERYSVLMYCQNQMLHTRCENEFAWFVSASLRRLYVYIIRISLGRFSAVLAAHLSKSSFTSHLSPCDVVK